MVGTLVGTTVRYRYLYTNYSLHFTGGIPQTLIVSFLEWLGIMIIFFFVRKNALRVMSLGLNRNLVLFRRRAAKEAADQKNPDPESREDETEDITEDTANTEELAWLTNEGSPDSFLSWMGSIWECLLFSDKTMLSVAGRDAVQYLRLQRFIIALLSLLTVTSMCVILPMNFQGTLFGKKSDFGTSTISNLGVRYDEN